MDTEKFPKKGSPEANAGQEGTSRRKLLLAGAAAVPVMVTIKGTTANAAGLNPIPTNWWGGGDYDGPKYPQPNDMLGSIACIQNLEMPWSCDSAAKDVCHKDGLDYDGWCSRKSKGYYYGSMEQKGGVMPATYNSGSDYGYNWGNDRDRENDEKCRQIYDYFYDSGRTNFWPGCKFDVSKERHCTYVQICLSTACWDSISTAIDIKGGKKSYF